MKTKDCKDRLFELFGEDGWKRIKKYKNESKEVVRIFNNGKREVAMNTGKDDDCCVSIVQIDDEKSEKTNKNKKPKLPKGKYYYAIGHYSDFPPAYLRVYIGLQETWHRERYLDDWYPDSVWKELNPVLDYLQLNEEMESIYSPRIITTKEELSKRMEECGFEFDVEFEEAMTVDDETEEECKINIEEDKRKEEKWKKEKEQRLISRSDLEVYVDEHINEAIEYLPWLNEVNLVKLLVKYAMNKQVMVLASPVVLPNGQDYIPKFEYIKAVLLDERSYDLTEEILAIKKQELKERNRLKLI